MKKLKLIFLIIFSLFSQFLISQNTVGLLSYDPIKANEGYNLIYPHNQPNVYLLNNCGEIVHTWEDDASFRPGNTAYINVDGNLYKSKRTSSVINDAIWAGGGGAILEIRSWDNDLIWSFEMNDSLFRLHHDFAVTDEGTIIALAWELKNIDECIQAGRDPSTLAQAKLWPDWIFEIDPTTNNIIWEWHAWDHLVQDFDSSKDNFGVIADHPELIDVNYGRVDGHPDWMHGNSLDYNDELDQILLSVPYFDEIWIIDKTTTTAQAASHNGGLSGKGGDLMYRWGNPRTYQQGDSMDQKLFFQHDAHWVDDFLDPIHPQFGKIALFNNRIGPDFSVANILNPSWDMYSWSYDKLGNVFFPNEADVTIQHPEPNKLWSTGLSSVQVLSNGNYLLTAGRFGYSVELTPDNEIVWEYKTPIVGGNPATQGDSLSINNNLTFRMDRYPIDFGGFAGKDLSPKGWIEINPDSTFNPDSTLCDFFLSSISPMVESNFKIYPNPASNFLTIEWDGLRNVQMDVIDMVGQKIGTFKASGGRKYIDTSDWAKGVYFISFLVDNQRYSRKVLIR